MTIMFKLLRHKLSYCEGISIISRLFKFYNFISILILLYIVKVRSKLFHFDYKSKSILLLLIYHIIDSNYFFIYLKFVTTIKSHKTSICGHLTYLEKNIYLGSLMLIKIIKAFDEQSSISPH